MSDNAAFGFGKFVPGFDFLQSLVKGAAHAPGVATGLPAAGNWIAPTLNVEELDKRISELKTVQYWLDQNSHAVKATIQALEVQKMTLATLSGMNLSMAEVAKAFAINPSPESAAPSAAEQHNKSATNKSSNLFGSASAPPASKSAASSWPMNARADAHPAITPAPEPAAASTPPEPASEPPVLQASAPAAQSSETKSEGDASSPGAAALGIDPMQWWGALTQQFQQIASQTLQEAARQAVPAGAGAVPKTSSSKANQGKPASKQVTGKAKVVAPRAAGRASKKANQPAARKTVGGKPVAASERVAPAAAAKSAAKTATKAPAHASKRAITPTKTTAAAKKKR